MFISPAIISFVSIVLMTVVGGLLVWLHYRLEVLRKNGAKLSTLGEEMTQTLNKTQVAFKNLKEELKEASPKLDKRLLAVRGALQDLEYVTAKAEKSLYKMDKKFEAIQTWEEESYVGSEPAGGMGARIIEERMPPRAGAPISAVKRPAPTGNESPAPTKREAALRTSLKVNV